MKKIITILFLFLLAGCDLPMGAPQEELLGNAELSQKMQANKKIKETYKLENAAFIKEAKDENGIQVEVGDKAKQNFEPKMKISRWEDEVSLTVGIPDKSKLMDISRFGAGIAELVLNEEKIEYREADIEYHYYDIEPSEKYPEGAFEYEIVLKEKPKTNVVKMTIETAGLDFFYQPELTQEEKDEGAERPENVVGSYAVYHSTKSNHKIGDKNYKSGKAFHIYRPKIIDADKNEVWGELHIDTNEGILSVTIPDKWLDKAVYPVVVDPTFGYTTAGATTASFGANEVLGSTLNATVSVNGSVDSISIYANRSGLTNVNAKGLITNSSYSILTNGISPVLTISTLSWYSVDYSSKPSVTNSNDYYPWFVFEGAVIPYRDTGGSSGDSKYGNNNYSSPTNPSSLTDSSSKYSIYATYTASGGDPDPAPSIIHPILMFE
jgi:hypothetical protein